MNYIALTVTTLKQKSNMNKKHNKYTQCVDFRWMAHKVYLSFQRKKVSLIIINIIVVVVDTVVIFYRIVLTIEGFNYFRIYSTNVKYTIR